MSTKILDIIEAIQLADHQNLDDTLPSMREGKKKTQKPNPEREREGEPGGFGA